MAPLKKPLFVLPSYNFGSILCESTRRHVINGMSSSRLPIPNRVKGGPSSSQIKRKTTRTPQPAEEIIVIDSDDDGAPAVHAKRKAKEHAEGSPDVEVT